MEGWEEWGWSGVMGEGCRRRQVRGESGGCVKVDQGQWRGLRGQTHHGKKSYLEYLPSPGPSVHLFHDHVPLLTDFPLPYFMPELLLDSPLFLFVL